MLLDIATVVLVLSDVTLAATVFILVARPDVGVAFVLRRAGMTHGWFEEHLDEGELERLRVAVRLAGWGGLACVWGWSFVVGALMTLGQVLGST